MKTIRYLLEALLMAMAVTMFFVLVAGYSATYESPLGESGALAVAKDKP